VAQGVMVVEVLIAEGDADDVIWRVTGEQG